MIGFRIDCSTTSAVVICHDCGWRGLAEDRLAARRLAASHERRAHPGQLHASNALSLALARARQ